MRHLWLFVVAALVLALAWRWQHPPALPTVPAVSAKAEQWLPLAVPDRRLPEVVKRLAEHSPWGFKAGPADDTPLTPPNWRITGVVEDGANHFALLQIEGQPGTQVQPGDVLPGGAKILAIQQDSLCILLNGKARSLRIYRE